MSKIGATIKYFNLFFPDATQRQPFKLYVFIRNYRTQSFILNIGNFCISKTGIKIKYSPNQSSMFPCYTSKVDTQRSPFFQGTIAKCSHHNINPVRRNSCTRKTQTQPQHRTQKSKIIYHLQNILRKLRFKYTSAPGWMCRNKYNASKLSETNSESSGAKQTVQRH